MPKPAPARDMIEGSEALDRFTGAMKKILSVSKDELKRRDAAWRRERLKPKRNTGR
ncbi:MAG TPA: hypothetical protein VF515_09040 [Candidatus Binatia bacterium]